MEPSLTLWAIFWSSYKSLVWVFMTLWLIPTAVFIVAAIAKMAWNFVDDVPVEARFPPFYRASCNAVENGGPTKWLFLDERINDWDNYVAWWVLCYIIVWGVVVWGSPVVIPIIGFCLVMRLLRFVRRLSKKIKTIDERCKANHSQVSDAPENKEFLEGVDYLRL